MQDFILLLMYIKLFSSWYNRLKKINNTSLLSRKLHAKYFNIHTLSKLAMLMYKNMFCNFVIAIVRYYEVCSEIELKFNMSSTYLKQTEITHTTTINI